MILPIVGNSEDDEDDSEESTGNGNHNDWNEGFPRDLVNIDCSLVDETTDVIFHKNEERVDPRVYEVPLNRYFTIIGHAGRDTSLVSGPIVRTRLYHPTIAVGWGPVTRYVQMQELPMTKPGGSCQGEVHDWIYTKWERSQLITRSKYDIYKNWINTRDSPLANTVVLKLPFLTPVNSDVLKLAVKSTWRG